MKKSLYLLVALAMIATMLLAACAAPAAQPAPQPAAPTEAPKAAAEPTAAPAPAGETTIAFSGFAMTNEFWNTLEKAAEAEAGAQGVKFINLTTDVQDAEAQKRAVDNAITQKVVRHHHRRHRLPRLGRHPGQGQGRRHPGRRRRHRDRERLHLQPDPDRQPGGRRPGR